MIKLNVGCGKDLKSGYVNLDQHKGNGADEIFVLPQIMVVPDGDGYKLEVRGGRLPYEDNSVDEIYCSHVIEDFTNELEPIMDDFWRVLKKGGVLHLKVPKGLSYGSYHHLRFFAKDTLRGLSDENRNYNDQPRWEMKMIKTNRYGLFTCGLLFLMKYFNQNLQRTFWKEYGKVEKENKSDLKKWIDILYKIDPKLGYAFEIEAILIKK